MRWLDGITDSMGVGEIKKLVKCLSDGQSKDYT